MNYRIYIAPVKPEERRVKTKTVVLSGARSCIVLTALSIKNEGSYSTSPGDRTWRVLAKCITSYLMCVCCLSGTDSVIFIYNY